MDNIPNEKVSAILDRKILLLSFLCFGIIAVLVYGYNYSSNTEENYDKKILENALEQYEKIKTTILSDELHAELLNIINARKECFSSQKHYDGRSATCKREYVNSIVLLARNKIKSAPMRGLFIRSIRECPIAGSLCNGEEDAQELECIEMEARCIEYYLDTYWRGGSFPDENTYTYKKTRKK